MNEEKLEQFLMDFFFDTMMIDVTKLTNLPNRISNKVDKFKYRFPKD